jgi:acyl dehydratase
MPGETRRITIGRSPGTVAIYLRALRLMLGRPQGALPSERARTLAPIEVSRPGARIDPARLARFLDVCGSPDDGLAVPPAYPECLFLGPMAEAVFSDAFPFSPFGLIHVKQRITLLRPVDPGATLDLSCRLLEIRETDRGFEVDFAMRADVASTEAWNGTTTLLSRNKRVRSRSGRARDGSAPWIPEQGPFRSVLVRVPDNTGRRYAAASGDWNPHHLYAATARLLGYRRAIAHGMWTFARTLAAIEREQIFALPIGAEALFKRPILLPAEIEIRLLDERLRETTHVVSSRSTPAAARHT